MSYGIFNSQKGVPVRLGPQTYVEMTAQENETDDQKEPISAFIYCTNL